MPSKRMFGPRSALMITGGVALAAIAVFLMPGLGTAQQPAVKAAPITRSDPASGKQMYMDYCAACHGNNGTGNGPAAAAMKTPPADLTQLAKNNGGKYPDARVSSVLSFGDQKAAHGSKTMPVWGPLFQALNWSSSTKEMEAKQRINRLNEYLASLQAK